MPANNNSLGNKLRHYRTNCTLSQKQVADALNIDRTAYTYYETGRSMPNLNTIIKLADIFGVDVSVLLSLEPQNNISKSTNVHDKHATGKSVSIYSLTRDEKTLLSYYRVLKPELKDEVLAYITNISR